MGLLDLRSTADYIKTDWHDCADKMLKSALAHFLEELSDENESRVSIAEVDFIP
jgi:hypothetical protein